MLKVTDDDRSGRPGVSAAGAPSPFEIRCVAMGERCPECPAEVTNVTRRVPGGLQHPGRSSNIL
jgi:hypothetical protein